MPAIHYECKPEECLLSNLGFNSYLVEHHPGSGRVCKVLEKGTNLIGWIDEDPNASHHPYYKSLIQKAKPAKHGLVYCYDKKRNNKLIIVTPNKLEDWIIIVAHKHKLKLSDYGLKDNPDELHAIINFNISGFQKLLHQLLKSPELLYAKSLISE